MLAELDTIWAPRAQRRRTVAIPYDGHMPVKERRLASLPIYPDVERPRTRGECADGPRPCPWVSCRQHLYLDVGIRGEIKFNFPDKDVDQIPETCALDVADRGGVVLEEVGRALNITRSRVRQVEVTAARRTRAALSAHAANNNDQRGHVLGELEVYGT
jgi:hypothetical protein